MVRGAPITDVPIANVMTTLEEIDVKYNAVSPYG